MCGIGTTKIFVIYEKKFVVVYEILFWFFLIHENLWLGIRESMKWTAHLLHTWIGTCLVWPSRHQGGYGWSHESYIWNSFRGSQLIRKEQFEGIRVSVAINLSNYLEKKYIWKLIKCILPKYLLISQNEWKYFFLLRYYWFFF